jgi:hypothetical protein
MTETTVSRVRLSGRLPAGEANGLDSLVEQLLETPGKRRYGIVAYDIAKITTVIGEDEDDPDERFPVVQIRSVEPITSADAIDALLKIRQESFSERTGMLTLPEDDEKATQPALDEDEPDGSDDA